MSDFPAELPPSFLDRFRRGDSDAAGMLEELFREPLTRFCQRYLSDLHETEEVVQEVLVTALTDATKPNDLRAWLYRTARNRSISRLRQRQRRALGGVMPPDSQVVDSMRRPISFLVDKERHTLLTEAVEHLPERYREVVQMRYVEGLHRAEIAAILGVDLSTVKWRLSEALKKLRERAKSSSESSAAV